MIRTALLAAPLLLPVAVFSDEQVSPHSRELFGNINVNIPVPDLPPINVPGDEAEEPEGKAPLIDADELVTIWFRGTPLGQTPDAGDIAELQDVYTTAFNEYNNEVRASMPSSFAKSFNCPIGSTVNYKNEIGTEDDLPENRRRKKNLRRQVTEASEVYGPSIIPIVMAYLSMIYVCRTGDGPCEMDNYDARLVEPVIHEEMTQNDVDDYALSLDFHKINKSIDNIATRIFASSLKDRIFYRDIEGVCLHFSTGAVHATSKEDKNLCKQLRDDVWDDAQENIDEAINDIVKKLKTNPFGR
eukprot:CAMPEP_0116835480 /NCGR_PEP_ID=MMETSP0418-20121206/7569_1 /TAXON_ID=1158023 /ORGANISM="Astrosyne radiata, Strain 13vi08-1A" /LENGTH=299 /DNA_ID=CAMNT_0004465153 /DNA_START=8 /DNA_END=907 /DNA_ORIENTATION=+